MTTGNKSINLRVTVANPLKDIWPNPATVTVGPYYTRVWNGSDAISVNKPRKSYNLTLTTPAELKRRRLKGLPYRPFLRPRNLPPQPYTVTIGYSRHAAHKLWEKSAKRYATQVSVNGGTYNTYESPELYYKVLSKLHDSMYGSGFAPLVFLAEGNQAFQMIAKSATGIRLALKGLLRGNPRAVLNALGIAAPSQKWVRQVNRLRSSSTLVKRKGTRWKVAQSLWLQVSYGWLPLYSDAEDAAKWLALALSGQTSPFNTSALPCRYTVSGFRQTVGTLVSSPVSPAVWSKETLMHRLKILILGGRIDPVFMPNLGTIAEVVWEKTPFSFVVDWWIPIGSYLAAVKTQRSVSGVFVVTESKEWTYSDIISKDPRYTYLGQMLENEVSRRFYMTRTVKTSLPVPAPFQDFLDKNQGYRSWRHAANAVALLTGFLHQKKLLD